MTWTVTKESGAVSFSDWPREEAAAVPAEQLALVQAFRSHPPISLKLTVRGGPDPFQSELAATGPVAPDGLALFLGQSRSIYEDLLNRLPMMIQVIDGRGILHSANQATAEILGYAPDELIGREALSLLTEPSRRKLVEDVLPEFFETGQLANVDVQFLTKAGGTVELRMSAVGYKNAQGRIERSIAVFADMRTSPPKARILVVEDQEVERAVAVRMLRKFGYEVLEAGDAAEALQILQDRDDVDLLFTDVVIPGDMNGFDLSQAATLIRPGLKIIHASGYPKDAAVHQDEPRLGDDLISKPYQRHELHRAIQDALAGKTASPQADRSANWRAGATTGSD